MLMRCGRCVLFRIQDDIIGKLQNNVQFTLNDETIENNLCKVQVFYEMFDYESIEESEAYPVA